MDFFLTLHMVGGKSTYGTKHWLFGGVAFKFDSDVKSFWLKEGKMGKKMIGMCDAWHVAIA